MLRLLAALTAAVTLLATTAGAQWPALSPPATGSSEGARDAALIVAIDQYGDENIATIPGAERNAQDWYAWLTHSRGTPPPAIQRLYGANARHADILAAAGVAAGKVGEGGRLWLVFIGHGTPSTNGQEGALVAYDAGSTAASFSGHTIPLSTLTSAVADRLIAPRAEAVFVIDACFSGTSAYGAVAPAGMQATVPAHLLQGSGPKRRKAPPVTILAASSGAQAAEALPAGGRPAFSYLLLGAMLGWTEGPSGGDGKVGASEALSWVRAAIQQATEGDSAQEPQRIGPDLQLTAARAQGPDIPAVMQQIRNPPPSAPVEGPPSGGPGQPPAQPRGPRPRTIAEEASRKALEMTFIGGGGWAGLRSRSTSAGGHAELRASWGGGSMGFRVTIGGRREDIVLELAQALGIGYVDDVEDLCGGGYDEQLRPILDSAAEGAETGEAPPCASIAAVAGASIGLEMAGEIALDPSGGFFVGPGLAMELYPLGLDGPLGVSGPGGPPLWVSDPGGAVDLFVRLGGRRGWNRNGGRGRVAGGGLVSLRLPSRQSGGRVRPLLRLAPFLDLLATSAGPGIHLTFEPGVVLARRLEGGAPLLAAHVGLSLSFGGLIE